jgi:hypothetical protein
MANDGSGPGPGKTDQHETYGRFITTTKWAVAAIAMVLIVLAILFA